MDLGPPRSLIFDLYGQFIRYDGGEISLQALTRLMQCFGAPPDSVRVLMSRLRREGWYETRRRGRPSFYALTPAGWELLDEGLQRIMVREPWSWDQQWRVVIFSVPESRRAARDRLRKRLSWLGFGPLAPSTWISPRDRLGEASEVLKSEPSARADLLIARSLDPAEDLRRARRCWDLGALARDHNAFMRRWQRRLAGIADKPVSGRDALLRRTQLVHEYRMFLFRDPDLPVELLPPDWPGSAAHESFLAAFEALREPAAEYYRKLAHDERSA